MRGRPSNGLLRFGTVADRSRAVATGVLVTLLVLSAPAAAQSTAVTGAAPITAQAPSSPAVPGETASPGPSSIIDTGDPRSNGQGPGLVGSPFAILVGVIVLGLVTAAGTALYLRVSDRR